MPRPLKQLAEEALAIQDACNPLGLTKGFAQATQELADTLRASGQPCDTRAICRHPVFRLWTSKLHDLANMGMSDTERYSEAYSACKDVAR
jgi:hypothetical protein